MLFALVRFLGVCCVAVYDWPYVDHMAFFCSCRDFACSGVDPDCLLCCGASVCLSGGLIVVQMFGWFFTRVVVCRLAGWCSRSRLFCWVLVYVWLRVALRRCVCDNACLRFAARSLEFSNRKDCETIRNLFGVYASGWFVLCCNASVCF